MDAIRIIENTIELIRGQKRHRKTIVPTEPALSLQYSEGDRPHMQQVMRQATENAPRGAIPLGVVKIGEDAPLVILRLQDLKAIAEMVIRG